MATAEASAKRQGQRPQNDDLEENLPQPKGLFTRLKNGWGQMKKEMREDIEVNREGVSVGLRYGGTALAIGGAAAMGASMLSLSLPIVGGAGLALGLYARRKGHQMGVETEKLDQTIAAGLKYGGYVGAGIGASLMFSNPVTGAIAVGASLALSRYGKTRLENS